MKIFIVRGCGLTIFARTQESAARWASYMITRGGVPELETLDEADLVW
jgi:hypothetical protein